MIDEELEPTYTANTATEEPAAEAPPVPAPSQPSVPDEPMSMEEALRDETLREEYDSSFKGLRRGKLMKVTVIQVEPDRVWVDTGTKNEGVIPLQELSAEPLTTAEGHVSVGDEITVVVLQTDSSEGNPILSKKRADFEDFWAKIEEAHQNGETLQALVTERVKGGLVVDIGVRGFVPATHVGNGKLRNIERYVGQTLPLKILEIDRERRKVVLSNREAEQENRASAKETIFQNLTVGEIVDGVVRRLVDYGAFVDIGGVDGLLHVSEMSWSRINHPNEVLREGDEIKVKILRMDSGAGKISLGYRQVLPDPWHIVSDRYKVGQLIEGQVTRLVQTGAFIKLDEGVEAWLPLSEMAARRIGKPSEVVSEGQTLQAQVLEMSSNSRRMVVSLRAMERQHEREVIEKHTRNSHRGGATIGERLGALKQFLTEEKEESEAAAAAAEVETAPGAEVVPEPVAVSEPEATPETEAAPEPEIAAESPAPESDESTTAPEEQPAE